MEGGVLEGGVLEGSVVVGGVLKGGNFYSLQLGRNFIISFIIRIDSLN